MISRPHPRRVADLLFYRHRRADCPKGGDQACRYCKKEGHMRKDCPEAPPMLCSNCGEEGISLN